MPKATDSPPAGEKALSDNPAVAVIEKKLRKYKKKLDGINGKKDKAKEGKTLHDDEKQMIASEPEVLRMLEELESLKAELAKMAEPQEETKEAPKAEITKDDIAPLCRFAFVLTKTMPADFEKQLGRIGLGKEEIGKLSGFAEAARKSANYDAFAQMVTNLATGTGQNFQSLNAILEAVIPTLEKIPAAAAAAAAAPSGGQGGGRGGNTGAELGGGGYNAPPAAQPKAKAEPVLDADGFQQATKPARKQQAAWGNRS